MMHVCWLEQREQSVPLTNVWLSETEELQLTTFRIAKRRADWRLGRWTAKKAVANYCFGTYDVHLLPQIEIRPADSGAPVVFIEGERAPVSISLSHRDGLAACAIAMYGTDIGCDVEVIETRSEAFLSDYLSSEERELVEQVDGERELATAVIWSAKESALKALQVGLRVDTCSVEVSVDDLGREPRLGWSPLTVAGHGRTFHGWWSVQQKMVRTLVALPSPALPQVMRATMRFAAQQQTAPGWKESA